MGVHIPSSIRVLTMIATPSPTPQVNNVAALPRLPSNSTTDFSSESANDSSPHTDPLDGSLGLYLAMCGLVLILILGVSLIFWRIHMNRRTTFTGAGSTVAQDEEVQRVGISVVDVMQLPTVLYTLDSNVSHPNSKYPGRRPLRAQIKALFDAVKLPGGIIRMKNGEDTSCAQERPLSVPSIVISECSPIVPPLPFPSSLSSFDIGSEISAGPSLNSSTSLSLSQSQSLSASASTSSDNLQVPGTSSSRILPLQSVQDQGVLHNPLTSKVKKSFASRRSTPNKGKRRKSHGGKENMLPASPKTTAKGKGRVYDMSQMYVYARHD